MYLTHDTVADNITKHCNNAAKISPYKKVLFYLAGKKLFLSKAINLNNFNDRDSKERTRRAIL